MKSALKFILRLAIVAGLFVWLIQSGKLDFSALSLSTLRYGWLMAALVFISLILFIGPLRWNLLLAGQGIRLSYVEVLRLSMVGVFFNNFMPGALGGDLVKVFYAAAAAPGKKAEAALTVLLDRFIGLLAMAFLAAAAAGIFFLTYGQGLSNAMRLVVMTVFIAGGIAGVFTVLYICAARSLARLAGFFLEKLPCPPNIKQIIVRCIEAAVLYQGQKRTLWLTFAFSWIAHLCMFVSLYCFGRSLGESVIGFSHYMFLVPLGLFFNALPGLPGGWGLGETAFSSLFSEFGSPLGAMVCLCMHLAMVLAGAVGGIVYLRGRFSQKQAT